MSAGDAAISCRGALDSLKKDNAFLKAGGVFNDDFIESYIEQAGL
ncbi:glutamine synthetase [Bosea vaviloviae]|nr:glutamine synthetase [Bosea vaviloviae]